MERAYVKNKELPDAPGVYLFTRGRGSKKEILYVGKATSLRDRVRSYFDIALMATRGPRIVDMVTSAEDIEYEVTATVLEALVREAALIRKYRPYANVLGKDDKSFLYACVTSEPIPRVITARGKDIDWTAKRYDGVKLKAIHGPFVSGMQLREALRLIRKIFPFFDTPRPITSLSPRNSFKKANGHARAQVEFNAQIGRYPRGVDERTYRRNIRSVSIFLSGEVGQLRKELEREMKTLAKEEAFEEAAEVRKQLFAIDHVQDVSLIKEDRETTSNSVRVEAFDTAHIGGTNAYGVMTVLVGGVPDKSEYRTFRIRAHSGKSKADDLASLKEMVERRLGHTEWPLPSLFVVDGGQTHKKTAEKVLADVGVSIPVAAVVKDDKHRAKGIFKAKSVGIHDADILLANAEAHRFALATHKKARSKQLRK